MDQKIKQLEERVEELEFKVRLLENSQLFSKDLPKHSAINYSPENLPQSVPSVATSTPKKHVKSSASGGTANTHTTMRTNPTPASATSIQKKETPFEQKIGSQFMGILAAVLILIGLGFFSIVFYILLPRIARFICMYLISISFLVVGYFITKKRRNAFSLALMACGCGAVYLSILLTQLYFHYINQYILYFLFLLWSASMLLLTKKMQSFLFLIIGYLGLFISVIFGVSMPASTTDIVFLCFFQCICLCGYFFSDKDNNKNAIAATAISLLAGGIIWIKAASFFSDVDWKTLPTTLTFWSALLFLCIPCACFLFQTHFHKNKTITKTLLSCINYIFLIFQFTAGSQYYFRNILPEIQFGILCAFLFALILLVILEQDTTVLARRIVYMTLFVILYLNMAYDLIYNITITVGFLPLVASLFLIAGLKYKQKKQQDPLLFGTCGILLILNILFPSFYHSNHSTPIQEWTLFLILLLLLVGALLFFVRCPKLQTTVFKSILYSLLFILLGEFLNRSSIHMETLTHMLLLFSVLMGLFLLSGFSCEWISLKDVIFPRQKRDFVLLGIMQLYAEITIFFCILFMYHVFNLTEHWLLVLTSTFLFCANAFVNGIRLKTSPIYACYFGIRTTIFIPAILYSFLSWKDYTIVCSLICLILSIIFILIGFRIRQSVLRIYGLILSMLCVFKLTLFDISYTNPLLRIFGFIFAGLLCFFISFIYNYIAKKYTDETIL